MGPEFFQTPMGQKYYNHTLPSIAKSLETIAKVMLAEQAQQPMTTHQKVVKSARGMYVDFLKSPDRYKLHARLIWVRDFLAEYEGRTYQDVQDEAEYIASLPVNDPSRILYLS